MNEHVRERKEVKGGRGKGEGGGQREGLREGRRARGREGGTEGIKREEGGRRGKEGGMHGKLSSHIIICDVLVSHFTLKVPILQIAQL